MPDNPNTPPMHGLRDPSKDISDRSSRAGRPWRLPPLVLAGTAVSAAAVVTPAAAPGRWPLALAALAGAHLVMGAAGMAPRSSLLGPNLTRLPPDAAEGAVALTFDDGPDPEVTPAVLELLDQAGARASFFLIGHRAQAHPELVKEIVRRGHRVENHTQHHPNAFAAFGPWRTGREIDGAQRTLTPLAGRAPLYFRPPAGFRSPLLEPLLARRGLTLATWTRRGFDTRERNPGKVLGRLVHNLAPGDILLLHDGNAARTTSGRPVLLEVLPYLLDRLARDGLASVPLPDPAPGRG